MKGERDKIIEGYICRTIDYDHKIKALVQHYVLGQSNLPVYLYTVKNVVYYMALWSANHTVIRVVNTMQCHIIQQLVWYAHFIFTVI